MYCRVAKSNNMLYFISFGSKFIFFQVSPDFLLHIQRGAKKIGMQREKTANLFAPHRTNGHDDGQFFSLTARN